MGGRRTYEETVPRRVRGGTASPNLRPYRYQGVPKVDPAAARAKEMLGLLLEQRKTIALRSSRLRALTAALHDRVAQAICDGVKVAAITQVSGMPPTAVRTIARARDDLFPSGQGRMEHLHHIASLANELTAMEDARTAVEQKRIEVLASARKSRLLDDYQLACASGLKHEEIRKMTRGKGSRAA